MRSGVKHTWLPWRRKYRPIPMPDGGTLQRIPEEKVGRDWAKWAEEDWSRWERGQRGYMGGGCPGCYYGRSVEVDLEAGRNPEIDDAARRRWARHAELDRIKDKAAGPCRCGGGTGPMVLHPGESWTVQVEPPDA